MTLSLFSTITTATLLLFILSQFASEAALARAKVRTGEKFSFNIGKNSFVLTRRTSASNETQYLFAIDCQQGGWTTNGVNRIGSGARLSWTGEFTIEKFSRQDAGEYSFPMEEPGVGKPKTMLILEIEQAS
ncbi:hypothetical protein Ddc_04484 [Ditylenchus destructor]|nr:hypothetical protein Ddc_04484 [Ditylenchus destructor]